MNGFGGFGGGNGGSGYPDAASHFGARLRRSGIVPGRAPGSGNQQGAWNGSPLWRNPNNPHGPGFAGPKPVFGQIDPRSNVRQDPEGGPFGPPRPTGGPDYRTPFENRPNPNGEGWKGDSFENRPTGGFDLQPGGDFRPDWMKEGRPYPNGPGYGPKPTDIIPHGPWGGGNPVEFGPPKPIDYDSPGDPAGPRGEDEGYGPPPMGPNGYRNPLWARLMMRNGI